MKFTYKHFEDIKHSIICNEELKQELKNRQCRATKKLLTNLKKNDLIYLVK